MIDRTLDRIEDLLIRILEILEQRKNAGHELSEYEVCAAHEALRRSPPLPASDPFFGVTSSETYSERPEDRSPSQLPLPAEAPAPAKGSLCEDLGAADYEILRTVWKMGVLGEFLDLNNEMRDRVFWHYVNSGEMPYGTMKARDGDPDEWIFQRLDSLFTHDKAKG